MRLNNHNNNFFAHLKVIFGMKFNDRQEEILKSLHQLGSVEVEALAQRWSVTTQTVRRDLAEICETGLAMRTHGGAKRINTKSVVAYEDRRLNNTLAKRCVAEAAANLIPHGASLTLNIGTTTEMVAEALRLHNDLTVISNNINVVQILRASRLKSLVLIGGEIRLSDCAVIGEDAIKSISNFKVDFAIISASSIDIDGSILDFDQREVSVSRSILENARKRILVADVSKFDVPAHFKICNAKELDYVILNETPPPSFESILQAHATKLIIANDKNAILN